MARCFGDDYAADAQFARHQGRAEWSGTAVGDHVELARVESAFCRDTFDNVSHRGTCNAEYAVCGLLDPQSERRCDFVFDRAASLSKVKFHLPTKESLW